MRLRREIANYFLCDYGQIDNIIVYDENGIVFKTNMGWFSVSNNPFKEIKFDTDLKKRNKVNLTRNEIFFIKTKEENQLYIHKSFLIDLEIEKGESDGEMVIQHYDKVSFKVHGIKNKAKKVNGEIKWINEYGEHQIVTKVNYIFAKTEKYMRCKSLSDLANSVGIKINPYDVETLMSVWDIKKH